MKVQKIDSLDSLVALEMEWKTLDVHSGIPFTSWDWAIAWWTHLREDKLGVEDSLFVRAIRNDAGELVAVAPMLISRRPSVGPLCVRQLQFFGADPNITELRGLITLPQWRTAAYRALLAHALESADQWDSMQLSGVPSDLELSEFSAFPEFEWTGQTPDYELSLPASWEEFRAALPRNIKESLRKCYNSLKRDGREWRVEIAERAEQVDAALARLFAFHHARALQTGTIRHGDTFDSPQAQRFLAEICHRFAARGCLRIFQVVVDEQIVAVRVGFIVGPALYLYYSGYDCEFGKYSVMTTAVAEAIKYAISKGMKTVNLSTGNDVSKKRWNPVEVVVREARLNSPSRRARCANRVYGYAVRALERLPALRRATKFLARRSATTCFESVASRAPALLRFPRETRSGGARIAEPIDSRLDAQGSRIDGPPPPM